MNLCDITELYKKVSLSYWKYIILFLVLTCILLVIVWIIISYYMVKWFKIKVGNYIYYLNKYNDDCVNILKKYGEYPIKKIYLVRNPVSNKMKTLLNIVTFNNFYKEIEKYKDKFKKNIFFPYHASIIFELNISKNRNKLILLEKNNSINLRSNFYLSDTQEMNDLQIKQNKYTINKILKTTRERIGDNKFFNWEICKNNCQILIKELLITLKKYNKNNKKFVYQKKFTNSIYYSEFSLHIIRSSINIFNMIENFFNISLL